VTLWHDVALEEYKALRAEILTAMQMQYTTLTFGTAAIGVLFGFGANVWKASDALPAEIVFLIAVPALAYLVLVIWMGEVTRMIRAGQYVRFLESRINRAVHRGALGWETFLREKDDVQKTQHRRWNRATIFFLYGLIAGASIALGWQKLSGLGWQIAIPVVHFAAFGLVAGFLYWQWCVYLGTEGGRVNKAFCWCCRQTHLDPPNVGRENQRGRLAAFHRDQDRSVH
jgi:hypothetical protein